MLAWRPLTIPRRLALVPVGILLAAALLPAQLYLAAYGTVLRSSFVQRLVREAVVPLQDAENHRNLVRRIVTEVLRGTKTFIPLGLQEPVVDAAVRTITPAWIESAGQELARELWSYLKGQQASLAPVVHLGSIKASFAARLGRLLAYQYRHAIESDPDIQRMLRRAPPGADVPAMIAEQVTREIEDLPESVDLLALAGRDASAALSRVRNLNLLYALFLSYTVPVALLVVAFVLSNYAATAILGGATLLVSGAMTLAISVFGRGPLPRAAAALVPRQVIELLPWLEGMIVAMLQEPFDHLRLIGVIAAVAGAVAIVAGVLLRKPATHSA